ncbi:centrosomal protein kizuna [Anabrus simplex]|uniref:centrosomal protein kizuna n=1 Tax=Anabrus simplex TaxID=316456 RepID=UPI0034DDA2EC
MSIQQRRAAMAKIEENAGFYKKMAELQEKLRRSEEERLKLEEKFTMMMKSCREDEEARIRALRERYEKFLEDDKRRHERNERIMQTLEKIESRAAILSAKTERLKLLRAELEAICIAPKEFPT